MKTGIPDWAKIELNLRKQIELWIEAAIRRHRRVPWTGGHDEGTFLSSWFCFHVLTGDSAIVEFLRWFRDGFLDWAAREFHHGYYPTGEVHHQPETFLIFLTRMLHLEPDHRPTLEAMEDAAHHIGNWVEGIPDWYDWQEHRFRSYRIGSKVVAAAPPDDYEVPDHCRLAQIALVTYLATGKARYLDLVRDYADKWRGLIMARDGVIPGRIGSPARQEAQPETPAEAVELHVAAGSIDMFMDLFLVTGEKRYLDPVRKMAPVLLEAMRDPYSEPPGALLSRYRLLSGDCSFDERAMELISSMPEVNDVASHLLIHDSKPLPHPAGIGRRLDDTRWGYRRRDDGIAEETGPSPASLYLAFAITGDVAYAKRALAKVRARFSLARKFLKDGREHGCTGGTVGALASGHGRCFGTGHLTSVFYPLVLGSVRFCNSEVPAVRYSSANGTLGLPEGVAALVVPAETGTRVFLCNAGPDDISLRVSSEDFEASLRPIGRPLDGKISEIHLEKETCAAIQL